MKSTDVISDAFGRVRDLVHQTVDGLTAEQLAFRADDNANSIGWLTWHLTRIQDDHVAEAAGEQQAWTSGGWADRFGLPFEVGDTGYGHRRDDVAAFEVQPAQLLVDYHDAVYSRTIAFVQGLADDNLDRVEMQDVLEQVMAHLTPRERKILALRFVEQLPQTEVAKRLGISQMHVSRLQRAAVEHLRKEFGAEAPV